jgi:hypothetical protein
LQPGDLPRRQEFCEWILTEDNAQPNFLNNVIYTDEAGFTQEGCLMCITIQKHLDKYLQQLENVLNGSGHFEHLGIVRIVGCFLFGATKN